MRHIVDAGLVAGLIVEDDAILGVEAIEVIRKLQPAARGTCRARSCSSMSATTANGKPPAQPPAPAGQAEEDPRRPRLCSNRAGAAALLAAMPKVCVVADRWNHFMQWVEVTAVVPYCVGRSPASRESQIGPSSKRQDPRPALLRFAEKYLYQKFFTSWSYGLCCASAARRKPGSGQRSGRRHRHYSMRKTVPDGVNDAGLHTSPAPATPTAPASAPAAPVPWAAVTAAASGRRSSTRRRSH